MFKVNMKKNQSIFYITTKVTTAIKNKNNNNKYLPHMFPIIIV